MTLWFSGKARGFVAYCMVAALASVSVRPAFAAPSYYQSPVNAATAGRNDQPEKPMLGSMSNSEVQGFGCLYVGGAATLVGAIGGSGQLIQVLTGGAALSVTPVDFALAVAGTIFAGFCAVGALGAPAAVRLWHEYYDGEAVEAPRS